MRLRRLLRAVERVQVLTLAPDEMLIITVSGDIDAETAEHIRRGFEARLDSAKVAVVSSQIRLQVVKDPERAST